jgi:DNA anti-recombination protein RmuC
LTQSTGSGAGDLDTVRQILFGADLARVERAIEESRAAAAATAAQLGQQLGDLERRVNARLEELSQRVTSQLEELSRRQHAHAEKVTQLLDQVMAELGHRAEALQAETRAGLDELRTRTADLERRKLNVADFGSSLSALGQRFAGTTGDEGRGG